MSRRNITRDSVTELFRRFAGQINTITIPRPYIDLCGGDHLAALLLSQILYWSDRTKDPNGWFAKSYPEWYDELAMTQYQIHRAIHGDKRSKKNAEEKGKTPVAGLKTFGVETSLKESPYHHGAMTLHYRVDLEKLQNAIIDFVNDNPLNNVDRPPSTMLIDPPQQCGGTYTETISETRTENKDSLSDDKSSQLISAETSPVESGGVVSELSAKDSNPEEPEKKKKERKADPEFDLIAKIWNNTAGGYVSCMQGMIFGSKSVKGEWKKCQFEPAATLDELTTFETYARQRMTEKRMTELPTAAVTIQRWFYDFRAEQERKAAKPKQDAFNPDGWTLPELDGVA
jgi:hypothetical protein